MNQPRGSPNLTFWHAEWSPPGYHRSLLCSKRGPVVVSAMEGIPRSGCPVLTHWGRQLWDFRVILFGKRCGTMRIFDHFGSILGILQWSSNILYSLEKPCQSHEVGLLTLLCCFAFDSCGFLDEVFSWSTGIGEFLWKIGVYPLSNGGLVPEKHTIWPYAAYTYIRCWFDAGSIRRVHLIYLGVDFKLYENHGFLVFLDSVTLENGKHFSPTA